jgi:hypothetical protein
MLLLRWLRIEGDKLPVLDRATLLDKIGNATDSRDRCLKLLGLDALSKPVDPWASIYTEPATSINAGRTNDSSDDTTLVPSKQATRVEPGTSGDATNETNSMKGGGE